MKRVNEKGRTSSKAKGETLCREGRSRRGRWESLPAIAQFTPTDLLYNRDPQISLCAIISKLLIFNVVG